ncbi:MAG: glycosyl transferase [Deltaproteobacteria bacterium]|nr:MAG: glycosyl transferase [Deltaproteobacteria bacterium]
MRILQITAALEQGGVERGTVEMAAFIVSQGGQSFVASQGGRMVKELEEGGTRHFLLPLASRNPLTILYSAWQLRKIIRREKIDLLHARSRAPAWAAYFAGKMTGVKMVTTFHGTHRIQNSVKKWYNSVMVRGVRVIAISQFIKNHILQNYIANEDVIDVAPRGFNPTLFDPGLISAGQRQALKQQLGLAAGIAVVSLPGRLTRWKGQILFLEALAQIKDLEWQALLIGGGGTKTAYIKELKMRVEKLGIADRVLFVGSQEDIVPYYAISDLVVSASTEPEAFGRVAVEAQAMAKPIIASAHGGSLETVKDGETGWLFNNGDSADLADKLRIALSGDIDLTRVGISGRQWVAENYTIDKMCQGEWNAYLKVPGFNNN